MKLNLSVDVPTLSQDEQHALSIVIQDVIDGWLWHRCNSAELTEFDRIFLREARIKEKPDA